MQCACLLTAGQGFHCSGERVALQVPGASSLRDFPFPPQAALVGGTTMVIGHVLPDKDASLLDAYEKCRHLADPKACCDYALHVGITWWAPKVSRGRPSPPSTGDGP